MTLRNSFMAVLLLTASGALHAQDWHNDNSRRDHPDNWDYRSNGDGHNANRVASEAQKRACEPDVFRVCARYIPDRDAITYCLHNNIDRLNPNCRAVMEGRLR
jgi:hypothetical protein